MTVLLLHKSSHSSFLQLQLSLEMLVTTLFLRMPIKGNHHSLLVSLNLAHTFESISLYPDIKRKSKKILQIPFKFHLVMVAGHEMS